MGLLAFLIIFFDDDSNASKTTNIAIMAVVWIWMQIAICGQRLHDQDRTAWWFLAFLVPYAGTGLMTYYCGIAGGTHGDNRFGPDPRQRKPDINGWGAPNDDEESSMMTRLNERLAKAPGGLTSPAPALTATAGTSRANIARPGTERPSFGRRV